MLYQLFLKWQTDDESFLPDGLSRWPGKIQPKAWLFPCVPSVIFSEVKPGSFFKMAWSHPAFSGFPNDDTRNATFYSINTELLHFFAKKNK
ncbi:MAG: hypothetical protein ACE5HS_18475, partial [bacterium]